MIKKFRFLTKCFGLIGAIALTLGFVSFKNVNAQSVNNISSDLEYYNTSTYFNNSNKPTWSVVDNEQLTTVSYDFKSYHNTELGTYELVDTPVDLSFTYYVTVFHRETSINYSYRLGCSYSLNLADYDYSELNNVEYFELLDCSYVSGTSSLIDTYVVSITNDSLLEYLKKFGNNLIGLSIKNLEFYIVPRNNFDISYIDVGVLPNDYFDIALKFYGGASDIIYNNGFNAGYNSGLANVKNNLYNGKTYEEIYNSGVNVGYTQGQQSVSSGGALLNMLMTGIYTVVIEDLNALLTPTIFGVPIMNILLSILGIVLIMYLIKKFK